MVEVSENYNDLFFTAKQLSKCIDIPILDVLGGLNGYLEYKGLLYSAYGHIEKFYISGFLIYQAPESEQLDDPCFDEDRLGFILACTEYSTRPELNKKCFNTVYANRGDYETHYNYNEFIDEVNNLGVPLLTDKEQLTKNEYNYDVSLINHKSNFTLIEASRIAANVPLKHQQGSYYDPTETESYQEILSDCVKGQNQSGFHLITKELWCHYFDSGIYEESSRRYDNGTRLTVSANINLDMTIISKSEFLRWCDFMAIETGLTVLPLESDESPEKLKVEIIELNQEVDRLRGLYLSENLEQSPPTEETELAKLKQQINENELLINILKSNSFSTMTDKLEAMLKASNHFWKEYNCDNLPRQQDISNFIAQELNLTVTAKGTNRTADELAKAIQPNNVTRK